METVQAVQADLVRKLQALAWLLRKAGPYVAIEILLPGGTLIALLLYLYRRRNAAPDPRMLGLKSVTNPISRPFHANSHGHEPFSR